MLVWVNWKTNAISRGHQKESDGWTQYEIDYWPGSISQFPHCDSRVLHAPTECEYCDGHPDWQQLRAMWDINFTGKYDPNLMMCPAEQHRGLDVINRWGGNVASRGHIVSKEEIEQTISSLQQILAHLGDDDVHV